MMYSTGSRGGLSPVCAHFIQALFSPSPKMTTPTPSWGNVKNGGSYGPNGKNQPSLSAEKQGLTVLSPLGGTGPSEAGRHTRGRGPDCSCRPLLHVAHQRVSSLGMRQQEVRGEDWAQGRRAWASTHILILPSLSQEMTARAQATTLIPVL